MVFSRSCPIFLVALATSRAAAFQPAALAASRVSSVSAVHIANSKPSLPRHAPVHAAALPAVTLLAAKAKAIPFTLLGRTSTELFGIQNLSLLSWALYLFLPRWSMTPLLALIAPSIHAALYGKLLLHMIHNPVPGLVVDFTSLEGIMPGFAIPDGAFAGWLHYCTFDPLVGLAIVMDAKRMRVPHILCVPCLVATALMGPVGFLAYLLLRTGVRVARGGNSKVSPPKGFEWGKTF